MYRNCRKSSWDPPVPPLVELLKAAPAEYFEQLFPPKEIAPSTSTTFAVSFVIAFQNRWDSFTNPDRWLIRFHDDLLPREPHEPHFYEDTGLQTWQGAVDPEVHNQHFPNYWHATDYMQHSIIGPVVVQIYQSDVLSPGIYSFIPKVTKWDAPGYILPDDRQLMVRDLVPRDLQPGDSYQIDTFVPPSYEADILKQRFRGDSKEGKEVNGKILTNAGLRVEASPGSPNPGFPLPGHVVTDPDTGPGTEIWKIFQMDENEW